MAQHSASTEIVKAGQLTPLAGQHEWTLGTSRVITIAKDKAPTASDRPGSKNDTVVLSQVAGVTSRVGNTDVLFPAGVPVMEVSTGGAANDSVTVYAVDGIDWTVGRAEVVFDKGQTCKQVPTNGATSDPVTATLSGGSGTSGDSGGSVGQTEVSGPDRWELLFNTLAFVNAPIGTRNLTKLDALAYNR